MNPLLFYGLMINKNQERDITLMVMKMILGFGGVEKGYSIVQEYLKMVNVLVNGPLEIQRRINN